MRECWPEGNAVERTLLPLLPKSHVKVEQRDTLAAAIPDIRATACVAGRLAMAPEGGQAVMLLTIGSYCQ
jgi:hypothetical protein